MADSLEGFSPQSAGGDAPSTGQAENPKPRSDETAAIRFTLQLRGEAAANVNDHVAKINRIANREVLTASAVVRDFVKENPEAIIEWLQSQSGGK
ncbi:MULTISPECIES: hypothetical protein [Roseobacteraceae]|uniref:hypothetical protein n=1 Tax=Roseobacteraceae TaxID=2854170 RepID=UPI0022BE34E5|nr:MULTISPECIES: hypothetical protein [Roseobacteraceae]MCZ4354795.1 hypothetical protein [Roseovarius aestuarii]